MRPDDALRLTIDRGLWWRTRQSKMRPPTGVPGEIVERMSPEVREALAQLTSASDVRNKTLALFLECDPLEALFRRIARRT